MKICRVCGFECEDSAELCPECGAELNVETEEKEDIIIENPVLAASIENFITAEIYKDVLKENGILFSEEGADEGIHLRFGGSMTASEIVVSKSDLEAAQLLYYAVLKTEEADEVEFEVEEI